jgi:hypothetical protein
MSVDTDSLVATYIAIRSQREKLLREFEAADKQLQVELDSVKAALLATCNEVNANSIRTQHGTVMRKLNERFFCTDWEYFRKFEQEHPDYDLRERRIHQSNFRQFMAEHQMDGLPPGVNVMREFDISVRKANSKD